MIRSIKPWIAAARPKTLSAAIVPVLVGTALAFRDKVFRPGTAAAALFGALAIQVGTNLFNDYYDFKKGADTAERVGPARASQSGLIAPERVLIGGWVCFGLAAACGIYLASVVGWPVLVIGSLSLLAGYAYTGGPYPLGYHGLGDLFVFVFFGLVAVVGTYWVQAGTVRWVAFLSALPVGALATAILVVNNLRDVSTDAKAGKRTLVVRMGLPAGRAEYLALLAIGFAVPVALWWLRITGPAALLSLAGIPLALPTLRRVLRSEGGALGPALGETARLQVALGVLFAIGLVL